MTLRAIGLVAMALLSAGCQDGPFLQSEQFLTPAGQEEQKVGNACIAVQKGNGIGGGRAPGVPGAAGDAADGPASGYSFSYESTGSGVDLTVVDGSGKVLAERSYDAAFIEGGRKDEVEVEVEGETLRFVNRGVASCDN